MRITNNMQTQSILSAIMNNQSLMATLQTQLASGQRVNSASDDPGSIPSIMNATSMLNKIDIYEKNITNINGEIEITESVLGQVTDQIQRLKELTIEAANGTNSPEQLKHINDEIKQIKNQLVNLANTKYQNNYIFAGNKTGTLPYEITEDGCIIYKGTPQTGAYQRKHSIADGVELAINFPGDKIFGQSHVCGNSSPSYGLFDVVNKLTTLLDSDTPDYAAIRSQLDGLETAQSTVLAARTENGAIQTRLNMTKEQHENNKVSYTAIKANVSEIDIAQVVSQLSNQQVALQASMYVGSQMNSISLLDYL